MPLSMPSLTIFTYPREKAMRRLALERTVLADATVHLILAAWLSDAWLSDD
ncbi:MAG: hypothetical protein HLUCCO16_15680 [Phormidium sp. OSCR]|nr:MAG: hypothetical protein HLUCCO16_15680 [Phormidium sp. OSCR]